MKKEKNSALEPIVDRIGEILAFLTILLILFMYINGAFELVTSENILNILSIAREVAIIAVIGMKGFEFALKRNIILTILFLALLAAVIIFMFFPGALPGWIPN